ncbi:MAG: 6-phosphofructokinase [Anaerolineae bacterium]|nr:6-phosphofructokinase [Anaerolineae bacterium]
MKRIGVLTSGGDSPGMNAFVRAVVRRALSYGLEVFGIQHGYQGLCAGNVHVMDARSVSGIIDRAGTILETARSQEFMTREGYRHALRTLHEHHIEALVVLGGDGSMRGAMTLHEAGIKVVGAPGTIDNDVYGAEMSIGADTGLNVAVDAIDMIRATASSHQRAFVIEVMGRDCGYLGLMAGLACGAEMICIPEVPFTLQDVSDTLDAAYVRGKAHCIVVVAEGAQYDAAAIAKYLAAREAEHGFEVRATILGHIQRGGKPTASERLLATRLGCAAVDNAMHGNSGVMVGTQGGVVISTPIPEVVSNKKLLDLSLYELVRTLENPTPAASHPA